MIKELIIRDFFSFKGEHTIELNAGVNILVGVHGSGKTSFLNAITMLYEGIAGGGLSALFRQWGSYNAIVNACGEQKPNEKNDKNETQIMRYCEDDFENREGELLAGQLWLNGEIGGKRR